MLNRKDEELIDALARMLMDERDHAHPWTNPVPSQIQIARMFVEDHFVPLRKQLREVEEERDEAQREMSRLRECRDTWKEQAESLQHRLETTEVERDDARERARFNAKLADQRFWEIDYERQRRIDAEGYR